MWAKHASFCLSENKVSSTQLFWYFSLEIKSTYYMYLELTRWNILTLSVGDMAYSDKLIIRWLRGKVIIAYLFTNRIVDRSTANIWTKPVFFFICKKKRFYSEFCITIEWITVLTIIKACVKLVVEPNLAMKMNTLWLCLWLCFSCVFWGIFVMSHVGK